MVVDVCAASDADPSNGALRQLARKVRHLPHVSASSSASFLSPSEESRCVHTAFGGLSTLVLWRWHKRMSEGRHATACRHTQSPLSLAFHLCPLASHPSRPGQVVDLVDTAIDVVHDIDAHVVEQSRRVARLRRLRTRRPRGAVTLPGGFAPVPAAEPAPPTPPPALPPPPPDPEAVARCDRLAREAALASERAGWGLDDLIAAGTRLRALCKRCESRRAAGAAAETTSTASVGAPAPTPAGTAAANLAQDRAAATGTGFVTEAVALDEAEALVRQMLDLGSS